ncbi:MAG: VWA domain-containing protein [Anaerolineae bacterium]|nr:VWA domain-containing protein [Anaerolineae bacterium]
MILLWPWFLPLLLLIPLIIAIYVWMLRRKRRFAVRYSSLSLIREAMPKSSRLRRHLPFTLFLLGLASLITAMSRPITVVEVPNNRATIILALDISGSMCATDILPNRLTAAQNSAISFIKAQAETTRIGIIVFANTAHLIVPPTQNADILEAAVANLVTARWTAIGRAILTAVNTIAEFNPAVPPSTVNPATFVAPGGIPRQAGEYVPDTIVLLTDGSNSRGIAPQEAAQVAAERGIRVYTIGFGTQGSAPTGCTRQQAGNRFERMGGGGGGFRRGIDEPTLQKVAEITGGKYFKAESADELQEVFLDLPTYTITQQEKMEISVVFTAIGTVLTALAIGLSLIWHPQP